MKIIQTEQFRLSTKRRWASNKYISVSLQPTHNSCLSRRMDIGPSAKWSSSYTICAKVHACDVCLCLCVCVVQTAIDTDWKLFVELAVRPSKEYEDFPYAFQAGRQPVVNVRQWRVHGNWRIYTNMSMSRPSNAF